MENISQENRGRLRSESKEDQLGIFYEIVYLPDNQICVDCGIEDKPVQFISVNNAVLLCEDCAKLHRELSSGISYVMSIADAGERYSPHKVELLKFGGNERFKNFFAAYWHPESGDPIFPPGYPLRDKYASNAGKYYRHKIQQLAKQETPQMEPPEWNEAVVVLEEDMDDWYVVNEDERQYAMLLKEREATEQLQKSVEGGELSQSKFGQEVKQFFKEDVKNFFGKVSEFTKKTLAKKEHPERESMVEQSEESKFQETQNKKEKGLKLFGSKVKLGFSKIFAKKEKPPVQFEEHKEQENPADPFFAKKIPGVDDIKLIEDEGEIERLQKQDLVQSEIVAIKELSLEQKQLIEGTFELQKSDYIEPSGLIDPTKPSSGEPEEEEAFDIDDVKGGECLVDEEDLRRMQREEEEELLQRILKEQEEREAKRQIEEQEVQEGENAEEAN
ncbi:hypothetical protein FGO68_gene2617 [Halteria grandinella]|uniref:Arf-GAP domain-containing protein n=1 Tax=Halteria grandinella TaxID=5974 RepID=A0A8J8TAB7_HALGN|nr:hypothetical protein FGO68_gene2617 [Halteria grandinella]